MDRTLKGRIAEARVLTWMVESGHSVYLPWDDNAEYDMLVIAEGSSEVSRVSIKYCDARHASGNWKVEMRNVSRRANNTVAVKKFNKDACDFIAVYLPIEERVVVVEADKATENILTIPAKDAEDHRVTRYAGSVAESG